MALLKTAVFSAQFDSIHKSSNAVDGITTCPVKSLIAASFRSANTWLKISLGSVYRVRMVAVYARQDGGGMLLYFYCGKCFVLFLAKTFIGSRVDYVIMVDIKGFK